MCGAVSSVDAHSHAVSWIVLRRVVGRGDGRQATWHSGHSLAQTLFTCLYMHDHARTRQHLLLGALMDAVRASARCVQTSAA